ncbi:MAG: hypothetical protein ACHQRK_10300 [Gemmatimonadales bacterium]
MWRQRNSDCYALRIAYSSRARSSIVPAVVLGALHPQRPWAIALALGVWITLIGIVTQAQYASLLALAFAFAGSLLRRTTIAA